MPQFPYQSRGRLDDQMKRHAGIALDQSIDDRRGDGRHWRRRADMHLTNGRICEMFDLTDALSQLVEHDDAALKQCTAIRCWSYSLRGAIEKRHPQDLLHFRNGIGNRWLGN